MQSACIKLEHDSRIYEYGGVLRIPLSSMSMTMVDATSNDNGNLTKHRLASA